MDRHLTFTRIGTCNNCGDCCFIQSQTRITPCIYYNPSNPLHCKIYAERGKICQQYPKNPADLAGKSRCGYQFINEKGIVAKPTDDPLYHKRYLRIISI